VRVRVRVRGKSVKTHSEDPSIYHVLTMHSKQLQSK
jgi:hypothetical protein